MIIEQEIALILKHNFIESTFEHSSYIRYQCNKCNYTFIWHTGYQKYIRLPIEFNNEFLTCEEYQIKNLLE